MGGGDVQRAAHVALAHCRAGNELLSTASPLSMGIAEHRLELRPRDDAIAIHIKLLQHVPVPAAASGLQKALEFRVYGELLFELRLRDCAAAIGVDAIKHALEVRSQLRVAAHRRHLIVIQVILVIAIPHLVVRCLVNVRRDAFEEIARKMEDVLRLFDERRRDVVVEQLLDLWMVVKVGVILLDDGGLARLRTCARARDTVSAIARRQPPLQQQRAGPRCSGHEPPAPPPDP